MRNFKNILMKGDERLRVWKGPRKLVIKTPNQLLPQYILKQKCPEL